MNHLKALGLLLVGVGLGWWLAPGGAGEPAPESRPAPRTVDPPPLFGPAPLPGDETAELPAAVEQRMQWMEQQILGLSQRLETLERRQAAAPVADAATEVPAAETAGFEPRERVSASRIERLTAAGVAASTAQYIDGRLQEYELQRLYLRDRAVREGWFGTTRYTEAVDDLEGGEADLRESLDESDFDLYLYATGQPNRVVVSSVMDGSAAATNGLEPDDVIFRYAGERVFNTRELRDKTAAGLAGETVPVEVLRGGELLLYYLPRGPIGVRLNLDRAMPN